MTGYPVAKGSDCTDVAWNPLDPVLCRGTNATHAVYEGVCGVDGQVCCTYLFMDTAKHSNQTQCYHFDVGFHGAIKAFQALETQFLNAIDSFKAFDDLYDPTAVVAYAKGALVFFTVLQELHLLGLAQDGNARQFAQRAADWLESRVEFHTNTNVTLATVRDANSENPFNQEPMYVRKSCRPGDQQMSEVWLGCSTAGRRFTKDTNFVR